MMSQVDTDDSGDGDGLENSEMRDTRGKAYRRQNAQNLHEQDKRVAQAYASVPASAESRHDEAPVSDTALAAHTVHAVAPEATL